MAENEEQTIEEMKETGPATVAAKDKKGGASPMKWVFRIVILILVVLVEVKLSYTIVQEFLMPVEAGVEEADEAEEKSRDEDEAEEDEDDPTRVGGVYSLSDVIVNPAYSRGKRFFILSIVYIFEDKSFVDIMPDLEPIVHDRIISHLSEKTIVWLAEHTNREPLRQEMTAVIHDVLQVTEGVDVYFTKYVIQ